jgi:phosphatidylserine decarboxylase
MRLHKEGFAIILGTTAILAGLNWALNFWLGGGLACDIALGMSLVMYVLVVQFFRHPQRHTPEGDHLVIAPADGKVVVIEEVEETEFFKDKRLQVSIFMSPLNVHVNRYPTWGKVIFEKYHPGKYLVAWHPKSSTENERTTVVVENTYGQVLFRQIAGALARRIVCYAKEGHAARTGAEYGFIKFGSRIDLFFPVGTQINVKLGDKTVGGETVVAQWK